MKKESSVDETGVWKSRNPESGTGAGNGNGTETKPEPEPKK